MASKRRAFQVSYNWNQLKNLDENKIFSGKKSLKVKLEGKKKKNEKPTPSPPFLNGPTTDLLFPLLFSTLIILFSPHHVWRLRYWGFLILQHIQYENQGYPHLWYNLPLRSVPELCKSKFLNLPILVNAIYKGHIIPLIPLELGRENYSVYIHKKGHMQGLQIICWVELEGKFLVDLNYYIYYHSHKHFAE